MAETEQVLPEKCEVYFAVGILSEGWQLISGPEAVINDLMNAGLFEDDISGTFPTEAGFYRGTFNLHLDGDGDPVEYMMESYAKLELGELETIQSLRDQLKRAEDIIRRH